MADVSTSASSLPLHTPKATNTMPESPQQVRLDPSITDEELMLRVQQEDVEAYREITRRYLKRIYAIARRILPHDYDADDVVQDAFLRVWSHRDSWSPGAARFTTWLHRIVINRCIDYRRRPVDTSLDETEEPADERPDFDKAIFQKQLHAALNSARKRLPPGQQVALALYYNQGLTGAEVGAVMGLSQSAAEGLLKRARQQLRSVFAKSAIRARDAFDDH
jgi:RNA polymerase sigma-70 factor (ECF subfamily)